MESDAKQPVIDAGSRVPRAGPKRDEKATRWNRIWLPTAALFLALCALIYLDELLDLPHLVLGAPRTPVNWQEAILEVIMVAAVGICALSRLRRDVAELKRAEAALQPLAARYKAILAAVPDIIMEVDADKVYTWANRAGFEFFGEDVIGQEAAYYFEGEQDTYDVVQPLFNGDENVMYVEESWQRRQDGEKRLLAWWCRVLKDAEGNVTGALSTARDITERKQAEEALREALNRLEEAQRVANIGSWEWDAVEDVITGSAEFYRLFDVTPEQLTRYTQFIERLHSDDKERVQQDVAAALRQDRPYNTDYRVRLRDGSWRDINARGRVVSDPEGKPVRMVGTCMDITDRKQAEETLRRSEMLLSEMSKMAKIGAWQLDAATMKQEWTDETFAIHDRERGVYDPDSTEELSRFEPGSKELIGKAFEEATGQGKPYDLEVQMTTVKGNSKWVRAVCIPLLKDGKVTKLRGTVQDITQRKQTEEALKEYTGRLEEMVEERTAELRQSEEKSRAQYKGIPVPTYTWQKVGEDILLVDYNDAAEAIAQGKIADLVGIRLADMYRDTPEIREEIERCFAEQTSIEREMPYRFRSTDEERHLAVKYAFVPPDLVLVHTEDVTERVHAEQAVKQQSAELRKMVNLMAGREVRMAELKQVIRQLRAQLAEAGLEPVVNDPLLGEGA